MIKRFIALYIALSTVSLNLLQIYGTSTSSYGKKVSSTYHRYVSALFSAYDAVDASYIFKRLSDAIDKAMYNAINRLIISRQFVLHTQQSYRNDIIVEQD